MENNCTGFFQARKLTIKWHLLERFTFQNLLKNRNLLPAKKFGNFFAFEKESKKSHYHLCQQTVFENNLYNDFRVEISLWINRKLFDFKEFHSDIMSFQLQ